MFTRRQFIKHSGLLSLSSSFIPSALGKAGTTKMNLATLDADILQQVKRLKGDQSVSLTLLYPEGCLANLTPVIERFINETGVAINLSKIGLDDINDTILVKALQKNYHFDIALPATFGLPDLVAANALLPLDGYAEKYEPAGYKDYQLYNDGDYVDGKLYGYQTDGDAYVMFYNKPMLDDPDNQRLFAARYGYPLTIPQTWQQLDDAIRFFHQPAKNQFGGCLFRIPGYGAWEWWSRFHGKGFYPLKDDLTPQINNKAGVAALEEMIATSEYLHPQTATDGLFENWATFAEGNCFCNIGWGGSQKYFNSDKSSIKNQLYFAPAPGGILGNAQQAIACPIFNWGWNYVVSSLCPHPDIAYLLTLYACSPVMSTLSVRQDGYFDPFREEHYQDPEIETVYSRDFLNAHKSSMQNSIPDFYLHNQGAYLSVLQENIYLANQGSLTAKQALDITATEWQQLHENAGRKRQQRAWMSLKKKYPPALRQQLI